MELKEPMGGEVVLVEDNIDDAFLINTALKRLGFNGRLVHFYGGAATRTYLLSLAPPLPRIIIADHVLDAEGSGLDLLLWLKTQPEMAAIPFFVISGRLDAPTRSSMEQAGVTGIFIKGDDFDTTVEQMRSILAHLPPAAS